MPAIINAQSSFPPPAHSTLNPQTKAPHLTPQTPNLKYHPKAPYTKPQTSNPEPQTLNPISKPQTLTSSFPTSSRTTLHRKSRARVGRVQIPLQPQTPNCIPHPAAPKIAGPRGEGFYLAENPGLGVHGSELSVEGACS